MGSGRERSASPGIEPLVTTRFAVLGWTRVAAAGHRLDRRRRRIAYAAMAAAVWVSLVAFRPAAALAAEEAVFTDFEGIETLVGEPFDLGATPARATFAGAAWSGVSGQTALYFSGFHAWMVEPGGVGSIAFETPAASVEFRARAHPFATAITRITARNAAMEGVGQITLAAADAWQLVALAGPIASIEVENLDPTRLNAIDDFGFTPIEAPEPGSALTALFASAALAAAQRGRARRPHHPQETSCSLAID